MRKKSLIAAGVILGLFLCSHVLAKKKRLRVKKVNKNGIVIQGVKARKLPTKRSRVAMVLLKDMEVFVLKVTKKKIWYKIRVGKKKMWVKTKYIRLVEADVLDEGVPDMIAEDKAEQRDSPPPMEDSGGKNAFKYSSVGLFFPFGFGVRGYSGMAYGLGLDLDLSWFHLSYVFNFKPSMTMDIRLGFSPTIQLGSGLFVDLLFGIHTYLGLESSARLYSFGSTMGAKLGYSVNDFFYLHISPVILDLDFFQMAQVAGLSITNTGFYMKYGFSAGAGFRF